MDTNSVILAGRLTADPVVNSKSDLTIANFSLAVNHSFDKDGDSSFFNITCFNKTADIVGKFCTKGKQVIVTGYLKQERWEKDGQKNSMVKVLATKVQFVGSIKESNSEDVPF